MQREQGDQDTSTQRQQVYVNPLLALRACIPYTSAFTGNRSNNGISAFSYFRHRSTERE